MLNDLTTKIADLITGGLVSKQQIQIHELEADKILLEEQVKGWQKLLQSVLPIVEQRAGQILQETWKEMMSDHEVINFTPCDMPESLQKLIKSKDL